MCMYMSGPGRLVDIVAAGIQLMVGDSISGTVARWHLVYDALG